MIWDNKTETIIFRDPWNIKGWGTIFKHDPNMTWYDKFMDYINSRK